MKIESYWIKAPAPTEIMSLFFEAGYQAYFVGGCVRNDLLNHEVMDIDIATDATPKQTLQLAKRAKVKFIPTGIQHGTVTLILDKKPFQVTTFRKDIATDGRHAVVEFSDNLQEDACRRDFTINALYACKDGTIIDPLNSIRDIQDRRIRFIGDANRRIKEDYLRVLRFFRFSALYASPTQDFDHNALIAIAKNIDGLQKLSKERIGKEILKLLAAANPAPCVEVMRNTGVLNAVLSGADSGRLQVLIDHEQAFNIDPDPLCRLAALAGHDLQINLRLSNKKTKALKILQKHIGSKIPAKELGYRFGTNLACSTILLRATLFGSLIEPNDFENARSGAKAIFPVSSKDLIGSYSGAKLGEQLQHLEEKWINSSCSLNKKELLNLSFGSTKCT